jgi:hypothetical protein
MEEGSGVIAGLNVELASLLRKRRRNASVGQD